MATPNGPNPVSFTLATNGRGTITFMLGSVTYKFAFYMRKAGVAFVLEQPASDGSNRGRAGRFFPQLVTTPGGGTFIGSTGVTTAASENAIAVLPVTIANKTATFQSGQIDTSIVLGTDPTNMDPQLIAFDE